MSRKNVKEALSDLLLAITDCTTNKVTVNRQDLNTLVDAYERTTRFLDILIVHDGKSFMCKDCHNVTSRLELANRVCEEKDLCPKCGGWKFISTDEMPIKELSHILNNQLDSDSLVQFPVKVIWSNCGETQPGINENEGLKEVEVLRFSVFEWENGQWVAVEDASYSTDFPVESTSDQRQAGLEIVMDHVFDPLINGKSIKHICYSLSWIGLRKGIPVLGTRISGPR